LSSLFTKTQNVVVKCTNTLVGVCADKIGYKLRCLLKNVAILLNLQEIFLVSL